MPFWKQWILGLYYYASCPLRHVRNRRLADAGRAPIMVLMYHRVAHDTANGWSTHNDVFARQIEWLGQRFEFISLAEVQARLRQPRHDRPAVSITFDDGYAENCERALPLLLAKKIPVTYFVTTSAVLDGQYFPHDLAMGNRLDPNTPDQLRELSAAGVEIGGHTRTHPDLGPVHDEAQLYDEIVVAGRALEDVLGRAVRYFAFPFGQHRNLNRRGFEIAEDAGYEAIVSAYGGYNFAGDDPFHIQRMGVDGPMVRLKNWTTLDPFKQWTIPRYSYRQPAATALAGGVPSA